MEKGESLLEEDEEILWEGHPEYNMDEFTVRYSWIIINSILLIVILLNAISAEPYYLLIAEIIIALIFNVFFIFLVKLSVDSLIGRIRSPTKYLITDQRIFEHDFNILKQKYPNKPEYFGVEEDNRWIVLRGLRKYEVERERGSKLHTIYFYLEEKKGSRAWIHWFYVKDVGKLNEILNKLLPFQCVLQKKRRESYILKSNS